MKYLVLTQAENGDVFGIPSVVNLFPSDLPDSSPPAPDRFDVLAGPRVLAAIHAAGVPLDRKVHRFLVFPLAGNLTAGSGKSGMSVPVHAPTPYIETDLDAWNTIG